MIYHIFWIVVILIISSVMDVIKEFANNFLMTNIYMFMFSTSTTSKTILVQKIYGVKLSRTTNWTKHTPKYCSGSHYNFHFRIFSSLFSSIFWFYCSVRKHIFLVDLCWYLLNNHVSNNMYKMFYAGWFMPISKSESNDISRT